MTKIIAGTLSVAVVIWAVASVVQRAGRENENNAVEVCLDWDEIVTYCQGQQYGLDEFLERCRTIGVSSMAIGEESIASLEKSGKIVFFSNADYQRLKMLDLIAQGSIVSGNAIITPDEALGNQVMEQLKMRYGISTKVLRAGKNRVLLPVFSAAFLPENFGESMPLGFSQEKIRLLSGAGFKIILKPQNAGNPEWIFSGIPENFSGFLWEGKDIPGHAGKESFVFRKISDNKIKYIAMEFSSLPGLPGLKKAAPEEMVLGHSIPLQELDNNLSPQFWNLRWRRAVAERGVRFLLFHFWRQKPVEENLSYLREVVRGLKRDGFRPGETMPPPYPAKRTHALWFTLAFLAGIFLPLIGLSEGIKAKNPFFSYLVANAVTVVGGILVAALLYDVYFMQKAADMPLVKATMVLPLFFSIFLLYSPQQIHRFFSKEVKIKYLLFAGLLAAMLAILFIRSGNNSAEWLQPDHGLRRFMEIFLGIRPRTKEFLFGQPLLFLGFYFKIPTLLLLGMVGQVSVINTFFHAHSPVTVSLIRTLHGMWIGLLMAYLAIGITSLVRRIRKNQ